MNHIATGPLRLLSDEIETPIGSFGLVVDEDGRLCAAGFLSGHERMESLLVTWGRTEGVSLCSASNPGGMSAKIERYFAGELTAVEGLAVRLRGTDFQRTVWQALCEIPCGHTWSYGQLARRIGRPGASRAVGLANHANPIAVVVPCHRVIGADGSLTGYGAGIDRKRWLLAHECPTWRQGGSGEQLNLRGLART